MLSQAATTHSPSTGNVSAAESLPVDPCSHDAGEVALLSRASAAVARLRGTYDDLERRLSEAQSKIDGLEDELAGWRTRHRAIRRLDVSSLRRQIAFQCHPDRGGDTNLMKRLNALLDLLESLQTPYFAAGAFGAR